MRLGVISTRLNGTDGVSLEMEKWANVLHAKRNELFYCAGELGGYTAGGTLIPLLHFNHEAITALGQRAFVQQEAADKLTDEIDRVAEEIRESLREFVHAQRLEGLIVQNALAIPMNLPLAVALTHLIAELDIPTIAHHHDFFWERARFQSSQILDLLDTVFPPKLPSIRHVTINSIAQGRLKARRGIDSVVIPNVHDFATPPPEVDNYSAELRDVLGLSDEALLVLQPTRVIQRKGIEMAIELVSRLDHPDKYLYITHSASDEGNDYWNWLKREAAAMDVPLRMIDHLVEPERRMADHKIYSLWDVYPHADLVTYPSTYEGFGNALLEAIYFKQLIVINRYPVYNADIGPLGFEFVELDGFVGQAAVEQTQRLLAEPERVREMAETNYRIAQEHFSLATLERKLDEVMSSF